jgi:predicted GIY-YIG superfamily endonuclease
MTKKQAHIILYTLWENRYLVSNFQEPHTEYDWAVDLLINPPNKYSYEWEREEEDYSVKKISRINFKKAKEIQPDLYQGCYLLFNNENLVYVGVSNCIYSRLREHTRENIKEWDTVKFFEEHDRNKALEMENNFIQKYKPKYNIAGTKKHTKK